MNALLLVLILSLAEISKSLAAKIPAPHDWRQSDQTPIMMLSKGQSFGNEQKDAVLPSLATSLELCFEQPGYYHEFQEACVEMPRKQPLIPGEIALSCKLGFRS